MLINLVYPLSYMLIYYNKQTYTNIITIKDVSYFRES